MKIYLIAEKLSHSYSPLIHRMLGNYSYELKELKIDELETFIAKREFDGLNVTIPYKTEVIKYLDELSPEAKMLNSVNTILKKNGKLIGYNTDYFGFMYMVKKSAIDFSNKKVLIIGNGGASKTIQSAIDDLGATKYVLSHKENTPDNIMKYCDCDILVNTSPVGMYPNTGISPVDISAFNKCIGVLDLIYNPSKTQIMLYAEKNNIYSLNGLSMLVAQAKKASEIFTGIEIDDSCIDEITTHIETITLNITLIGMPGSGKTTIGKMLAEKLGREFIDTDDVITNEGMDISNIITNEGELKFREIEHNVSKNILNQSGKVIATGGGIVTYSKNIDILKQNSIIFYIKRDVEKLATYGRPLSEGGIEKLKLLASQREDKYKNLCDFEISNNSKSEDAVNEILTIIKRGNI